MKIKKSLLLSLSLMLSLSRAEDDGFYMSVGYQMRPWPYQQSKLPIVW